MVSSHTWLWVFRAGVGFLLLAALLFLLGFATDHWHDDGDVNYGLWNTCDGAHCSGHMSDELPAYHMATQAFQLMAVVCFALSPIMHLVFYCQKKRKDTGWKSRILDVGFSAGIILQVCSLLIFGMENSTPEYVSWSYKMSCSSAAIAFLGIVLVVVSRKNALYKFSFRSVNKNDRKLAAGKTAMPYGRFTSPSQNSPVRIHPLNEKSDNNKSPSTSGGYVLYHNSPHDDINHPQTNVNITININNNNTSNPIQNVGTGGSSLQNFNPSHQSQPQSSSSSLSSPLSSSQYYSHINPGISHQPSPLSVVDVTQQQSHTLPGLFTISGDNADTHAQQESSSHPPPAFITSDHGLTQVREAPKSSIAPYASPVKKTNQFGPADRRRTFENTTFIPNDNRTDISPSGGHPIHIIPVPTISVTSPPTSPPLDSNYDDPPSYSDVVAANNAGKF